jgi:hypothetical protein
LRVARGAFAAWFARFAFCTFAPWFAWFSRFAGFTRLTCFAFNAFAAFATFAFRGCFAFRAEAATTAATTASRIAFAAGFIAIELLLRLLALREVDVGLIAVLGVRLFALGAIVLACALVVSLAFALIEAVRLRRRLGGLRCTPKAEVVVGVLQIIFAEHTIARTGGVARELLIAL